MSLRCLARAYCNNKQALASDSGRCELTKGTIVPTLNAAGNLEDPLRVLTHPTLGTYTYPTNPDVTKNFIYAPSQKMDSAVNRTLSSNILVQTKQMPEDVVITEVWNGGGRTLAGLTEMARQFHEFWTTELSVGTTMGWEPLDVTSDRYNVRIVSVSIGGQEYQYKEVRVEDYQSQDSYLPHQLVLKLKIEKGTTPPTGEITLAGV